VPEPSSQRRGQPVSDAILRSCLELLAERGYAFSVEEVAERAGVYETTVYRRWPTKAVLVGAALEHLANSTVDVKRTEDPMADLTRLAIKVRRVVREGPGAKMLQALVAAADDASLLPLARTLFDQRFAVASAILDDAVEQGLLRPSIDRGLVWSAIVNPLQLRAITETPITDATARALVAIVLEGCRAPLA
jgi:AcrR family transcriptional regulator